MWKPAEFGRPYKDWSYFRGIPIFYHSHLPYPKYHKKYKFRRFLRKYTPYRWYFNWRMGRSLKKLKNI